VSGPDEFELDSGGGARRERHSGGRQVQARLGQRRAEGVARRWPASSSSARASARRGSGTAVAGEFELGSGGGTRRERQWPASSSSAGGGCAGRERHGGGGREAALCRQSQDARESGGRFTEATKMPIPRRRQNGALGKIDSVQSTLGIGSFGSTRRLFSMEAAYNLSQTGP
jgi:hypothetical protein